MRRLSLAVASLWLGVTQVSAAFKADSNTNIAIYWGMYTQLQSCSLVDELTRVEGQNSAGNKASQTRLSTYCSSESTTPRVLGGFVLTPSLDANVDIIPIAFMPAIVGNKVDFSNAGDNCTTFPNGLLDCPQIG